jgi:phosphatidylglycerol:prolipoprotein diacylglycerol transferase
MLPFLFRIGRFSLPTYGVLVAIAFLTALWMISRFAKEKGLNSDRVVNLGVYCALIGMLGAKLLMIALDPEYRAHPMEAFSLSTLQSAGIFFGGLVAALVFSFFYMRAQHLPILMTADIFAPGLALGHGIGRLGCFAAGCCWGKPTSLPWAVTFNNPNATTGVPEGVPLHPTQLYEAFGEGVICLILLHRMKRPHPDGMIIGMYLMLYGLLRFAVEFLRMHDASNPLGGPFTLEQWVAIGLAILGATIVWRPRYFRNLSNQAISS